MKKIVFIVLILQAMACNELHQVLEQSSGMGITQAQISSGLKEALQKGISDRVTALGVKDGFFKNNLVKILLPQELQKVDKALRNIGLSRVADEGLRVLNRAAEDAVHEAIPIFRDAIVNMTFNDAKNILMGGQNAATQYLRRTTLSALKAKFSPIIHNSFQKVGADRVWNELTTHYNSIPFVKKVDPDLTEYVTNEAMKGVFKVVAVEEQKIRTDISSRTTDLLRKVFALQDK